MIDKIINIITEILINIIGNLLYDLIKKKLANFNFSEYYQKSVEALATKRKLIQYNFSNFNQNYGKPFSVFMTKKITIDIAGFKKETTGVEILTSTGKSIFIFYNLIMIAIFSILYIVKYINVWNDANTIVFFGTILLFGTTSAFLMKYMSK